MIESNNVKLIPIEYDGKPCLGAVTAGRTLYPHDWSEFPGRCFVFTLLKGTHTWKAALAKGESAEPPRWREGVHYVVSRELPEGIDPENITKDVSDKDRVILVTAEGFREFLFKFSRRGNIKDLREAVRATPSFMPLTKDQTKPEEEPEKVEQEPEEVDEEITETELEDVEESSPPSSAQFDRLADSNFANAKGSHALAESRHRCADIAGMEYDLRERDLAFRMLTYSKGGPDLSDSELADYFVHACGIPDERKAVREFQKRVVAANFKLVDIKPSEYKKRAETPFVTRIGETNYYKPYAVNFIVSLTLYHFRDVIQKARQTATEPAPKSQNQNALEDNGQEGIQ